MTTLPVVVIGAGIGGLVSALELAAAGTPVVVLERAATPGGKMRQVTLGGAAMDAGPTVFTMRWVFDELFEAVGARLDDHLSLHRSDVLARHAWADGSRLDLFADRARSADAIGRMVGSAGARGYLAFCDRAERIYRTLDRPFLRGSRPNPLSLANRVGLRHLPDLLSISPFATLWQELGRYFDDPRLRQLFGRYATYCGASPYLAPATLMLVAHVEQEGVWRVDGGMHGVARSIAALAVQKGATIRHDSEVHEIVVKGGRAFGVRLVDGQTIAASAVVFNGDVSALANGLLGRSTIGAAPSTPPAQRSLSALTWNLFARADGFPLAHHNVFFSDDYRREFDAVFRDATLPAAPTVYLCAQDRTDTARTAPGNPERMLLIVNAPANGDARPFTDEELTRCESQVWKLMSSCGLTLQRKPEHTARTTPHDFERLFPATGGALYGRASHGWMASFSRPGARSRLAGLYLAGGSVHPGPGVPMAALSGRQAAASVLRDLALRAPRLSMSTSRPAATPGGTSTR